ncbi:MAG TPA: SGNH/GDSL hydrolase family protein [Polyangia bacterium]
MVLAAAAGSAEPAALVIPARETATVLKLLPAEGESLAPARCRLTDVQIRTDEVEVRFACPTATAASVVLVHPGRGADGDRRTRFFALRDSAPPQPRLGAALAAFIAAREQRHGGGRSPWAARDTATPASHPASSPAATFAASAPAQGAGWGAGLIGVAGLVAGGVLAGAWVRRRASRDANAPVQASQPGRWLLLAVLGFAAGLLVCELTARIGYRRLAGGRSLACDTHRCRLVLLGEIKSPMSPLSVRSYPDGVDYWLDARADEDGRGGNAAAAPRRAPGRRRVAFVGDSVTFGNGVPTERTFVRRVAAALGDGVEVWNLAVPGHDLDQHRITVAERAAPLQPDAIVVCLWLDDVGRKGMGPLGAYRRWRDHRLVPKDPLLVRTAWGRAITRRSRFAELVVLRSLARAEWVDQSEHDPAERQRALGSLRSIAASADAAHARLVVVLMAPLQQPQFEDRSPRSRTAGLRALAAEGLGPGVPILDARDLLGPLRVEEIRLDPCCHLNSEGHRRLGEALTDELRRLRALERAPAAR